MLEEFEPHSTPVGSFVAWLQLRRPPSWRTEPRRWSPMSAPAGNRRCPNMLTWSCGFIPSVASARVDTCHATTQNTPSGIDASTEDGEGYPPGFGPIHLMADVLNTTSGVTQSTHNDDSAKRRLENFTKKVVRKRAFPLIREPPKQPPAKAVLLLRSNRLVAQSLSQVPAKRGEILIMQRSSLVMGLSTPSAPAMKAYDALFQDAGRSRVGSSESASPLLRLCCCPYLGCPLFV
jgi:hypothetical protein